MNLPSEGVVQANTFPSKFSDDAPIAKVRAQNVWLRSWAIEQRKKFNNPPLAAAKTEAPAHTSLPQTPTSGLGLALAASKRKKRESVSGTAPQPPMLSNLSLLFSEPSSKQLSKAMSLATTADTTTKSWEEYYTHFLKRLKSTQDSGSLGELSHFKKPQSSCSIAELFGDLHEKVKARTPFDSIKEQVPAGDWFAGDFPSINQGQEENTSRYFDNLDENDPHADALREEDLQTMLRMTFTEFHNSTKYSNDNASAYLGDELSVAGDTSPLIFSPVSESPVGSLDLTPSHSLITASSFVNSGFHSLHFGSNPAQSEPGFLQGGCLLQVYSPSVSWGMPSVLEDERFLGQKTSETSKDVSGAGMLPRSRSWSKRHAWTDAPMLIPIKSAEEWPSNSSDHWILPAILASLPSEFFENLRVVQSFPEIDEDTQVLMGSLSELSVRACAFGFGRCFEGGEETKKSLPFKGRPTCGFVATALARAPTESAP